MRRRGLAVAAAAVALLATFGSGSPALGVGPDRTGWWTRTNVGPLVPIAVPTGVPEGGLSVAGDPDGRSAVSALHFSLAEGELATTLQLPVESSAGLPSVLVCRTAVGWSGQAGGPLESAPADACEEGSVPAAVSEDGTTLTADVAGLGDPGGLDVMLVPADGAVFRLVLGPPGEDALTTSAPPAEPEPLPEGDALGADTGGTGTATFDPGFAPAPLDVALPAEPLAAAELPALPDDVAEVPPPQTGAAPDVAPVAAPVLTGGTDRVQVLFALLFADVLLMWWWLLRREQRAPRSLLAFAGAVRTSGEAAAGPVRGVGRFARVRSGPAVGV